MFSFSSQSKGATKVKSSDGDHATRWRPEGINAKFYKGSCYFYLHFFYLHNKIFKARGVKNTIKDWSNCFGPKEKKMMPEKRNSI